MNFSSVKRGINSNKHEIGDVIYLIALQGLNYVAPLLVLPYLMVVLGAEKFGYIGFSLAVCQYLMMIVDFGFNLSATKRIALVKEDKAALNRIFSAVFFCKLALLALSFCLLFAISLIPQFEIYRKAMFVMFSVVVGNAFLFVFLFQGLGQIRWISIINCIAKLSVLPLTFVFVNGSDDYLLAALLQGGVSVLAAILSVLMILKNRWVGVPRFDLSDCKAEMKESWPIFLSSATSSLYVFCFVLILGFFAAPDEVGRYSASDKIIRAVVALLLSTTIQAFYPSISRMSANYWQKAVNIVRNIMILIASVMAVFIVVVFIIAPYLPQWLGEDYTGTETIICIMSFATLFISMGGVYGQLGVLAMGNYEFKKKFSKVYVRAGVVAIILVLALSPVYEGIGAAIAIVVTEAFVGISMYCLYRNMLKGHK